MNIQLYDIKLYIAKSQELIIVKITQAGDLLFNLETTAEVSPIKILLDKLQYNLPLQVNVNQYVAELPLQFLEEGKQYKLNLETQDLQQDVIRKDDTCHIAFKVRFIMPHLPTIQHNTSEQQLRHKLLELGKGTSQFQSSSSLRHSIPEVSFCQAPRFEKSTTLTTEFNYQMQTTFGSTGRAPSLGYGNKYICPLYVERNAMQNPGPGSYFQETPRGPPLIRKSNWSHNERFKEPDRFAIGPSPAEYEVAGKFGDKPKIVIGERIKPLATFQESVPGPQYDVKQTITEPSRFNRIGLGYGNKIDLSKNDNVPGPGTYEQPSVFKSSAAMLVKNGLKKDKNVELD